MGGVQSLPVKKLDLFARNIGPKIKRDFILKTVKHRQGPSLLDFHDFHIASNLSGNFLGLVDIIHVVYY